MIWCKHLKPFPLGDSHTCTYHSRLACFFPHIWIHWVPRVLRQNEGVAKLRHGGGADVFDLFLQFRSKGGNTEEVPWARWCGTWLVSKCPSAKVLTALHSSNSKVGGRNVSFSNSRFFGRFSWARWSNVVHCPLFEGLYPKGHRTHQAIQSFSWSDLGEGNVHLMGQASAPGQYVQYVHTECHQRGEKNGWDVERNKKGMVDECWLRLPFIAVFGVAGSFS